MANTDELRYIQAFSRIIGVKEDAAIEYAQRKGLNALVDNAAQLLATPVQREKHQAFLDLYSPSEASLALAILRHGCMTQHQVSRPCHNQTRQSSQMAA